MCGVKGCEGLPDVCYYEVRGDVGRGLKTKMS